MEKHTRQQTLTAVAAGLLLVAVSAAPATAQQSVKRSATNRRATNIVIHRRSPRPATNITLNLRNAPVRTALMQMFQKAHRDYALSNDLDGSVTIRLTNKSFDEALRLIANNATTPFTYQRDSGVYFVRPRRTTAVRDTDTMVAQATPTRTLTPGLGPTQAEFAAGNAELSPSPRLNETTFGNSFGYAGVPVVPGPSYPVPLGNPVTFNYGWPVVSYPAPTIVFGSPQNNGMPPVYYPNGGIFGNW